MLMLPTSTGRVNAIELSAKQKRSAVPSKPAIQTQPSCPPLLSAVAVGVRSPKAGAWHQYAEEDIAAFLERYIDSAESPRVLGVTRLTVQAWARAGRIQPLTGPEIDGSHAYRFEKAALVQWRPERLTFGEAMALLGVSKATLDRWAKQGKLAPLEDIDGNQRWFARTEVA
jgi:predicted DNA-binding transcriptional regulator AlpA